MVARIINPETGEWMGVAPLWLAAFIQGHPLPPLKFCKTKPTEARMCFRINKSFRKRAKNEPT